MIGPRTTRDEGVSLVELLVAATITAVLLTLMGGMFVQIMRTTSDGRGTRTATGIASTVMNEIAGVIRQGAQVSTSATGTEGAVIGDVSSLCAGATGSTPTCLIIDTYSNVTVAPGQAAVTPVRVVFSVNGAGNLVERRYAPTLTGGYYTFSNTAVPTSTVVNGPVDTTRTGTNALFVYRDVNDAPVVPTASGLTAAQAATVTAITVNVSVANGTSHGPDPVLLSNEITMPNIALVNGGN